MDYGNLYDADSDEDAQNQPQQQQPQQQQPEEVETLDDEEFNLLSGLRGFPPDQLQYQQEMQGLIDESIAPMEEIMDPFGSNSVPYPSEGPAIDPAQLFDPYPALPALQYNPSNDDIFDVQFAVQIGETRFRTLREAIAGAPRLIPENPGFLTPVYGRNAASFKRGMVDRYPYYDDGPRVEGEENRDWEKRIINARNQMGVITRPEVENMDSHRAGESNVQARKRRDAARNKAESDDTKHKRRLDPTHPNYDVQYAALWHAQQASIRQHSAEQRAVGLQNRREFDANNNRPAGPDPQAPGDGGDDLFGFTWHRRPAQTGGSAVGATPQQQQQGNMQSNPTGNNPGTRVGATRCKPCKKSKKGCDLVKVGSFPCTRCKEKNLDCTGDTDIIVKRIKAEIRAELATRGERKYNYSDDKEALRLATEEARTVAGQPGAPSAVPAERLEAIPSISGPAPELPDRPLFSRRDDEGPPRRRSASPIRGVVYGDKCDNCKRYGRPCEDERPCLDCLHRGLICNGSYLNNPYRSPRSDGGSDRSGYGTFGQTLRDIGYGGGNGGTNNNNNSSGSAPGGFESLGNPQPYQESLENAMDFALDQALPIQQPSGGPLATTTEGYNAYNAFHDTSASFGAVRRFNDSNASSSQPSLMATRPQKELENAARASYAYNETAE
ncbi:hypothetical protein L207DRAFT_592441 [Hyaloscypha variabilis F]|uniref:Zn(2)-C6 fungal-type domain-containing protein n=1 Tax=Hyaloscypha variabilis (strain UAMH 11265 / GT02V1 / F) TaxID=1149755 RepID=A0A2J6QWP7_HYAVF|nr:hypothetical protein L207DRAFT_592441 [Hyaloscypha variabilis F]